jgi:hypothetical protein
MSACRELERAKDPPTDVKPPPRAPISPASFPSLTPPSPLSAFAISRDLVVCELEGVCMGGGGGGGGMGVWVGSDTDRVHL